MKKFLTFVAAAVIFASIAPVANAGGNTSTCQPIYGGGQTCQSQIKFTINKMVQSPTKGGNFVDNLTVNDPRFGANQDVNFKISITNSGNTDITNLNVVDTFPQFLTFVAGVGNANAGASQVNFVIGKIKAGQTLDYTITAKTADDSQLPSNQAVTCVTNNVVATATDGTTASDNAQLCIEKQTTTTTTANTPEIFSKPFVKNVPSTGPETDILFGLMSSGALGFYLKRKSN